MEDPFDKAKAQFLQEIGDFASGKRKKYPWLLAEPLYVDPKKWGPDEPDGTKAQIKYRQEIDDAYQNRWELLFLMYGIDPIRARSLDGWKELITRLAPRHVPGLQVTHTPPPQKEAKRKRGAPRKHSPTFHAEVVAAIEEARMPAAKGRKKLSISAAIKKMAREGSLKKHKMAANSFRQRYYDATKIWTADEVMKYPLMTGLFGKSHKNSEND